MNLWRQLIFRSLRFYARGHLGTLLGVTVAGTEVRLTPKEFDLLRYFASNPNVAIPHTKLLQAVWGPDYGEEVEYLRVFINQLRKKIEPDPSHPEYLLTEPWVGYRLNLAKSA